MVSGHQGLSASVRPSAGTIVDPLPLGASRLIVSAKRLSSGGSKGKPSASRENACTGSDKSIYAFCSYRLIKFNTQTEE
jgi:hypothetical protein